MLHPQGRIRVGRGGVGKEEFIITEAKKEKKKSWWVGGKGREAGREKAKEGKC